MSRTLASCFGLVLTIALSACEPNVGDVVEGSIAGIVVKGPVAASEVTVFSVSASGRRDAELASATTDPAGTCTVGVGGHFGPALVCARNGTFTEEATGGLVSLGSNELCALIDN